MNNYGKILLIFLCLVLLSGCNKKELPKEDVIDNRNNYTLSIDKTEKCLNQVREYYTYQDRKVYFVCLDEIYLKRSNIKDMTLEYHLSNANQTFEASIKEFVKSMKIVAILRDGGTKVYKKDDYTIIECNTLDGNKDIYFGDASLEYNEDYCITR